MWIQVRSMDGKTTHKIDGLSKLTKIEELRKQLIELFDAQPEQQRLFYRGKQVAIIIYVHLQSTNILSFITALVVA